MPKFYVTYGMGTHQGKCFSVVEADNSTEARKRIFDVTNGMFASMYDEAGWTKKGVTQQELYNLKEIPLMPQIYR